MLSPVKLYLKLGKVKGKKRKGKYKSFKTLPKLL